MDNFFYGFMFGIVVVAGWNLAINDTVPAHVLNECEKDLPRSSSCKLIAVEDITKEINNGTDSTDSSIHNTKG